MHPAFLICIYFAPHWIPRGILGLGLGLFSRCPNSHGTCCHGNLLFTRFLIGWVPQLEFNPLFQDFWCSFLKVSKYYSTFPRVNTLFWGVSENSSYTSKRRVNCTLKHIKNTESHTHIHCKRHFISTHPWRRTSKSKIRKTWKSGKQHYSGADREQIDRNPDVYYKSGKQHYGGAKVKQ